MDISSLRAPATGKLAFYANAHSDTLTLRSFGRTAAFMSSLKGAAADLLGLRDAWERDGTLPITNPDKVLTALSNAIHARQHANDASDRKGVESIRERVILPLPAGKGRSDPAALVQATRAALAAYEFQHANAQIRALADTADGGVLDRTARAVMDENTRTQGDAADPAMLSAAKTILSHRLPAQVASDIAQLPGTDQAHTVRDYVDAYITSDLRSAVEETINELRLTNMMLSAVARSGDSSPVSRAAAPFRKAGYPAAAIDSACAQVRDAYPKALKARIEALYASKGADEIREFTHATIDRELPGVFEACLKEHAFGKNHDAVLAAGKGLVGALLLHEHPESFSAANLAVFAEQFQAAADSGQVPATPQQRHNAIAFALEGIARSNHTSLQDVANLITTGLSGDSFAQIAQDWASDGLEAPMKALRLVQAAIVGVLPPAPDNAESRVAKSDTIAESTWSRIRRSIS